MIYGIVIGLLTAFVLLQTALLWVAAGEAQDVSEVKEQFIQHLKQQVYRYEDREPPLYLVATSDDDAKQVQQVAA